MCAVDAKLTEDTVFMIFRRLFCALHYKHTGSILPRDGKIFIGWLTNAYTHRGEGFSEFLSLLRERPTLTRTNISLNDQFDYSCLKDPSGSSFSAFFCVFRTSFIGYGLVFDSAKLAGDDFDPAELQSPFDWTES